MNLIALIPSEFIINIASQIGTIFAISLAFLSTFFLSISQQIKKVLKVKSIPLWLIFVIIIFLVVAALGIAFGIQEIQNAKGTNG